ncbi:hypothetical protein BC829DRAFT_391292 [Chytridium lagenaria]|nr:hypothetical protein BC829DRAFT_391292 [Chytridium lagenaria]
MNSPSMPALMAADPVNPASNVDILSSSTLSAVTPPTKKAKRSAGSAKGKRLSEASTSSDTLLNVVVVFKFKDFQGNRTKPTAREIIPADSIQNFYLRVWERAQPHVQRLVTVPEEKNGIMEWDARTEYTVADLSNFITFSDDKGHRSFPEGVLPPYGDLLPFRATIDPSSAEQKILTIHVHAYGNAIVDKTTYDKLVKTLLKKTNVDRSGATNAEGIKQIQARLMEMHKENYAGTTHAWFQLAATIASKPKDEQEGLILCPSQLDDIKRFQRPADNFEAAHRHFEVATKVALNETRSGRRLLGRYSDKLNHLKGALKRKIISWVDEAFEPLFNEIVQDDHDIQQRDEVIQNFSSMFNCIEYGSSASILERVVDQGDLDH